MWIIRWNVSVILIEFYVILPLFIQRGIVRIFFFLFWCENSIMDISERRSSMKKKNGFTLVELMIVIVIIGVLAAVAIPKFSTAIAKACHAEAMYVTEPVRASIIEYYGYRGHLPEDLSSVGWDSPDSIYGRYVNRVVWKDQRLITTFSSKRYEISMDTVIFSPIISNGSGDALIAWEVEHLYTEEPPYDGGSQ